MSCDLSDVLRVTAIMKEEDAGIQANVYLVRIHSITGAGIADATVLADMADYLDGMYDNIDTLMSNRVDFYQVNVFNVTQDRPLGNTSWPTLTHGNEGANILPTQVAAFIQGNTGYSRCWARKFVGGFTETHNESGGIIAAALIAALVNMASDWLAGWTGTGGDTYEPVVYSSKFGLYRVVAEAVIREIWATIRRRRIGKGA
jgi:hypothetical protein